MVACAERDADERHAAFDRDLGHGGERAVTAGDSERLSLGLPRQHACVVLGPEEMNADPAAPRRIRELFCPWPASTGTRIDHEESGQSRASL
jgi:hypothetical protein